MTEVKTLFDAGVRMDEAHSALIDCLDLLNLIVSGWEMRAQGIKRFSLADSLCILGLFPCYNEECGNCRKILSPIQMQLWRHITSRGRSRNE